MKNKKSRAPSSGILSRLSSPQAPLPSRAARQLLATKMGVSPQQIKVWFRNAWQRKRQDHSPFKV